MENSPNFEESMECFTNLTTDQKYSSVALSGVCSISLVISIPTIVLATHEFCIKNRLSDLRTERLVLYLMYGSGFISIIGCFEWLGPLSINSKLAKHGCSALGFLLMFGLLFTFAIILCMGIQFLIQICKPRILNTTKENKRKIAKRLEALYLGGSLSAAILLAPWLWVHQMFGYNLWICWMVSMNEDCRPTYEFTAVKTVFYVILLSIALFSFCVMIIVHVLICSRKRNINNIDVWVYSIFIVLTLIIFMIILVVTLIKKSPSGLHFANIISLGILPLNVSIFALIAVIYKKCRNKKPAKLRGAEPRRSKCNYYQSIDKEDHIEVDSERLKNASSRIPTTYWKPPATHTSTTSLVGISIGQF